MLSGFYTAASGILVQQRTLNVLTNNIANVETPGYRAERVVSETFEQELMTRIEKGNTQVIGAGSPIRLVRDVPVNFALSSLEETGRPFDLALSGEGYFNVRTPAQQDAQGRETAPAQTLLTRKGNFELDEQGFLILPNVGRVLGKKGEIALDGSYFTVKSDGEVYDGKGKRVDRLLITQPAPEAQVEKIENGLYRVADPIENRPVTEPMLRQNMLERSNIDVNREYTLVMEAQRAFQSCSQALKIIDSMNQKSASQIAAL